MMRRRIALDRDVAHDLRTELDRPTRQDPSSVARLAPGAARDEVNVARPALHSPNLLVGANGSDRADECDSRENPESGHVSLGVRAGSRHVLAPPRSIRKPAPRVRAIPNA